jgi:hypothetical protein
VSGSGTRRLAVMTVLAAVAVTALTGCTSGGSSPSWSSPGGGKAGGDSGPGSQSSVCAAVRTAVTADMKPVATAFGTLVGKSTADDSDGVTSAQSDASTAIKKLGTDISTAGAKAGDADLKKAASTSAQQVDALVADPTYLSGIKSMNDVATATTKLQQATTPISTACQGA